ncbi:hypothetical protein [Actinomadura rudentiformis]|uniref:Uncharacterized protein n=1 Tax=Actinomadura rudentiformis TaxID=359158 RepID=A0A6H9YSP3_9ACTN|nr:hypothetical protein [Actinomadura rudentiformis]KAB2342630.1 hypothetical protein F8566_36910 [Actinomadura rudentiformis]
MTRESVNIRPAGFAAIMLAVTGGLQGAFVGDGVLPALVGATVGLAWGLGAALLAARFIGDRLLPGASNTLLFAGTVTTGLVFASGFLGAIERSAVGPGHMTAEDFNGPAADAMGVFFNVANGSTEWLIMPVAVLLAWRVGGRRRHLVVAAAAVFYLVRAWTYLYFGPHVVSIEDALIQSGNVMSADVEADIERWSSLNQIRTALDAIVYALLLLAAFVPFRPNPTASALPGSPPA